MNVLCHGNWTPHPCVSCVPTPSETACRVELCFRPVRCLSLESGEGKRMRCPWFELAGFHRRRLASTCSYVTAAAMDVASASAVADLHWAHKLCLPVRLLVSFYLHGCLMKPCNGQFCFSIRCFQASTNYKLSILHIIYSWWLYICHIFLNEFNDAIFFLMSYSSKLSYTCLIVLK